MKVARTVIAGGKAGDNIKRLPIGKVAYPVALATGVAPTHYIDELVRNAEIEILDPEVEELLTK